MKFARMNYQQEYIDCLWCEFTMPPTASNDFAIHQNRLHIWPAGSFMFIALPNLDKSFVCTLFGPVDLFKKLEAGSDKELVSTFDKYFPGVSTHIKPEDLVAQFKRNPHLHSSISNALHTTLAIVLSLLEMRPTPWFHSMGRG